MGITDTSIQTIALGHTGRRDLLGREFHFDSVARTTVAPATAVANQRVRFDDVGSFDEMKRGGEDEYERCVSS